PSVALPVTLKADSVRRTGLWYYNTGACESTELPGMGGIRARDNSSSSVVARLPSIRFRAVTLTRCYITRKSWNGKVSEQSLWSVFRRLAGATEKGTQKDFGSSKAAL